MSKIKLQKKPISIPLRNWHKTKDGKIVDKAYEDCIHFYRRDEVTKDNTCHMWCTMDTKCCEETSGTPCTLLQYGPGIKSDKIRYIYFKISESEQKVIEDKLKGNR